MMTLPYGNGAIELDLPKERLLGYLLPREVASSSDADSIVREAIRNPVDGFGLQSAAKRGNSVVIIADDYTRPTPSGQICRAIIDELNSLGIDDSYVTILAAGGLHRHMNEQEIRSKFGDDLIQRVQIRSHDAWDNAQLEYLGETGLNKRSTNLL